MFRIGSLDDDDSDQEYTSVEEAEIAAIELSINDHVIAVWNVGTNEIVALVYQLIAYHP